MSALPSFNIQASAVHAFLGVIRPSFRRVAAQAKTVDGVVRALNVTVLVDESVGPAILDDIREDVSLAVTYIVAGLPSDTPLPMDLVEDVQPTAAPLPPATSVEGVIFDRWEASP